METKHWKHLGVGVLFGIGMYAGAWTFNHMGAWLGVAICAVTLILSINYIINQIKKSN